MEHNEKTSVGASVENKHKLEEFILECKIAAEDVSLIKKFFVFSKNLVIGDFHNYFQFDSYLHEQSMKQLENQIATLEKEAAVASANEAGELKEKAALYKLFLKFGKKYGGPATYRLERLLERNKNFLKAKNVGIAGIIFYVLHERLVCPAAPDV